MKSELYRANAYYHYRNLLLFLGHYSYYKISDGNSGNDIQFRLGKKFFTDATFGYEYYYLNFAYITPDYYSPHKFYSHSLWGEYNLPLFKDLDSKVGGEIGYVPPVDFIISEIYTDLVFKPFDLLNIAGRFSFSNSFRYNSSYRSLSFTLSAYWSIY